MSDFPEVLFWQFSNKSVNASQRDFPKRFFGLDYVWRPHLTKNSNHSESSLFIGGAELERKLQGVDSFLLQNKISENLKLAF